MSDNTKSCIAFVAVFSLAMCLLWIGGFDFDDRNPWVAYYVGVAIAASFGAAMIARGDL